MSLFKLVKATLDPLYAAACAAHGPETDAHIAGAIRYLSTAYNDLTDEDRQRVDYRSPVTRFAYVYKYVAAHASYIEQLLETFRAGAGGPLFRGPRLRLSCIGGGPGSDLIAVLKYLGEHGDEQIEKVTTYLVDGEQGWADTWTELDDSLDLPFSLNTNFQRLDVTEPLSWATQRNFLNADVFTISYFVSEVMSLDRGGEVSSFWNKVFASANSGAVFLYSENGAPVFNTYFDRIWSAHPIDCIYRTNNVRTLPSYSEDKSHLGEYLQKFGHFPKIQAYLSTRILRKR